VRAYLLAAVNAERRAIVAENDARDRDLLLCEAATRARSARTEAERCFAELGIAVRTYVARSAGIPGSGTALEFLEELRAPTSAEVDELGPSGDGRR